MAAVSFCISASNSGGAALLAHFSAAEIAELSTRLRPDIPTGLDYYPLPAPGERFPVRDPALPSRVAPRPDDPARFLQGLLEGEKKFDLAKAGLKVERDVNNATAEGQITRLQSYASSSDVAAVAISVIQADNPAIIEEMRKLQSMGIPVITVDGDVNRKEFRDARSYYIGTDNVVGGRTLGTLP